MTDQNLSETASGDTKHGASRKADQSGITIYSVFPGIEFAFVDVHSCRIIRERKYQKHLQERLRRSRRGLCTNNQNEICRLYAGIHRQDHS